MQTDSPSQKSWSKPIGTGEVISRAVMTNFKRNIVESAGDFHFCTGQRKAAVHALSDSDAILLVDADNRINQINRKVMLHNI